jgi:hypothetical protein
VEVQMNKLGIPVVVFVTCFLSASAASWAADKPTEADVQQITLKAAALIKDKGVDVGRKTFDADGEFGEIYVNVVSDKGMRLVSGAKVRAMVEILLAPTRGGSIQAECDHGARDIWPVAWRGAGAFAEAPGQSDGA